MMHELSTVTEYLIYVDTFGVVVDLLSLYPMVFERGSRTRLCVLIQD